VGTGTAVWVAVAVGMGVGVADAVALAVGEGELSGVAVPLGEGTADGGGSVGAGVQVATSAVRGVAVGCTVTVTVGCSATGTAVSATVGSKFGFVWQPEKKSASKASHNQQLHLTSFTTLFTAKIVRDWPGIFNVGDPSLATPWGE
jgi:hypothetical protein